ncbi:hypothetical protein B0920_04325 [Massilia sp. KIM]|uniref:TonB-dependent receptor domain-containing protein n=1 Tax=Massilia sp. KIM TaxID=1955422 RepID=UPI00098FC83B|nr:TonB-dependent receptor [Massilia sp. KIM]OON62675.1 hypothetical protein B0920_04325 [Massilia sp. KIM]
MRNACKLALTSISLAVLTLADAAAQEAAAPPQSAPSPAPASAQAGEAADTDDISRVVVTGSTSLKRTVRESSVAISVLDRADLDRKAPQSTAAALELIPGIFVEPSGGEVSNNFSVRGLAGGAQSFIQFQEDGLPVFYTNALSDTILKQELAIDRLEAVRGGTSGILTVQGAGATINFITHRATDEPEGAVRLTGSSYGTRRIDLRYGGGIGNGWYAGMSGFYRSSDSVRDVGFKADHGGILRAYLGRKIAGGDFSVNVKLVDDHNTFLLPIPLRDPGNPRGIPGLDPNKGTMISYDNAVQVVRTSPATGALFQTNDLTDGVATKSTSVGYAFDKDLGNGVTIRAKGRYTDFKNDFNAVFSYDNESLRPAVNRLDPARHADVAAMLNRFAAQCGGRCTPGLRYVNSGAVVQGTAALNALNGNGLVAESITAKNKRNVEEFVNDISATWTTARNSLTAGLLSFDTRVEDGNVGASLFLGEVRNQPARLDIVALDPAGKPVGYLTENGILKYGAWGEGGSIQQSDSNSLYLNNEFRFDERLRLDGGLRYERYNFRARQAIGGGPLAIPGALDANGQDVDNIIANNEYGGAFSGRYNTVRGKFNKLSWTLGSNYLLNDNLALYARYASSYQANAENPVTDINFGEIGLRYVRRGLNATLTAFRTDYKDFRFSRQFGTDTRDTTIYSDIEVKGLEFEAQWRPLRWAQLTLQGVVQDSGLKIKRVDGPSAASVANAGSYSGNRPERTPNVNYTVSPSILLPDNRGEIFASVHFLGVRYADLANSVRLPRYHVIDLGMRYQLTPSVTLNASLQNVDNEIGLTEGNPRAGFAENPGVSDFFYARPIVGRNFQLSLTASF